MDMMGHCVAAAKSGVLDDEAVFGDGIAILMLPNILHVHDWAYRHAWTLAAFAPRLHRAVGAIRAHVVADWVVHFGWLTTRRKAKCGWAYRRMAAARAGAADLFATAQDSGLLHADATCPAAWNERQQLDFAHSMTEYALDVWLERAAGATPWLADVRRALVRLRDRAGQRALLDLAAELGARSTHGADFLAHSMRAIAEDAADATRISDFAVRTAVRKFGLRLHPRSDALVRDFITELAATLDAAEVTTLLDDIGAAIRCPAMLYDGPWEEGPRDGP